ncbi:MAG: hypothetical protein M1602_02700, partial [Firmicutes bacterium]|nr:hypothetical protein [Bacillota bacterium]
SFPTSVTYTYTYTDRNDPDRNDRSASFYLDAAAGELRQQVDGGEPPERVIATGITAVTFREFHGPGPSPLVWVSLTGQQGNLSRTEEGAVAVRVVRAP